MNIYLVRHGTTEWNSGRRIQGRTDIELDAVGKEMARQTGLRLHENGIIFDRVFSSPLKRAYATAELIGSPCLAAGASPIFTDKRLTELGFGCFEGKNVEEMTSDPDCIFRYFKTDPKRYNDEVCSIIRMRSCGEMSDIKPDSDNLHASAGRNDAGIPESLESLLHRASEFIINVIEPLILSETGSDRKEPDVSDILISGHGAVNRALLMYFNKSTDLSGFWGTGLQPNCGITKISCTTDDSGRITYDVQDECIVLYDSALGKKIKMLL
ncbi:MAG: histidine phosphatase family protein [Lachnospiraceae bacterium]|nr:histidine phosphatase family protein [Lachnospiraceae bacterium]